MAVDGRGPARRGGPQLASPIQGYLNGGVPRIMGEMQFPRGGAPRRRRLGRTLPALVVGLALLLSSCGGSDYRFVGSQGDHVFLKVPSSWASYNGDILLKAIGLDGTPS